MADLGPRDRLDVPIWNAIDANNFKQALKLVDKRLIKKPSEYLHALKTYIRSRSSSISEKSAVLLHIEELSGKKTVIGDLEAIDLYDEALMEVLPGKESSWGRTIGELRWQHVKALPKDEENVLKCFQECLANSDLDHARQISNVLEKTYPSNRSYIFWNISTMFLYALSDDCPEAQKRIWGGLALGQITKLASATRQATDSTKLPLRAIQTPQEILLLHRITQEYGKQEQRLEYLADVQLGPDSVIAKGEWELWRLRLQLLEECKQWQELFDITTSLLVRARTKDAAGNIIEPGMSDWIVWEAFLKSAIRLEGHKQKPIVLQELEAHLDPESGIDKTWRRNASLAWVKFCFKTATPFSVIPGPDGMGQVLNHIPIIIKYLQKWGDANAAYNDLKPFVARLDAQERAQLLKVLVKSDIWAATKDSSAESSKTSSLGALGENLSTVNAVTQTINVYKLRYLLVSTLPEYERVQSPLSGHGVASFSCAVCSRACGKFCEPCLNQLAKDSIKSYEAAIRDDGQITKNLLSTDRHPADDFCILAAMCLYKLSLVTEEFDKEVMAQTRNAYVVQATILLEYGWTKSKSNFQFSLLLVRFYTFLGCGSLALRAYQRLSLKQIQLDTLSYTMFDRLSHQHPHNVTHVVDASFPPKPFQELIKKQHKVYRNARTQIAKNMWTSFKQNNYNSVFEMREASYTLSKTLAGAMSVVESRKLTRITEPEHCLNGLSGGFDILQSRKDVSSTTLVDTNDYLTFPNFECTDGTTFEHLTRLAPGPSNERYQADLVAEKLKMIVSPRAPEGENQELLFWLQNHVAAPKHNEAVEIYTKIESHARSTEGAFAVLLLELSDKSRWTEEKFQIRVQSGHAELNQALEDTILLIESRQQIVPAFWDILHELYTAYDIVKTTLDFADYVSKQGRSTPESMKTVGKEASEAAQRLLKIVLNKAKSIKKGLDEGGWIDKLLDGCLPESGSPQATGEVIRDLVDENFLEEWAGLVVESWGESVQGFNLLKPVT